jgi:hypothetical protein
MKPDHEDFRQFLNALPKKLALDRIRSYWTKYAFHFTDVRNAANILKQGRVLSRANLKTGNFVDIASPSVIAHTRSEVKNNVRLYFRPRTPTQHQSEGIRPADQLWESSHCPVPVFLLFDLFQILVRDDCLFSDGNLAALGFDSLCSSAAELATFDFKKIYSDSSVTADEKREIIKSRNAEIVIPGELDLTALKLVYCRSAAEKETLLYLLPAKVAKLWAQRIAVASTATLFFRKWAFVETAVLDHDSIVLNFSPDSEKGGPFELLIIRTANDNRSQRISQFYANRKIRIGFKTKVWEYKVEVYLDNHLAYAGSYDGADDIPF